MWLQSRHDGFQSSAKGFAQKNWKQLEQAFTNVEDFIAILNAGGSITIQQATQRKCYHNEGQGLYAADQTPPRHGVAKLRLYFYPDAVTKTVHLIRVGKKDDQKRDIALCRPIVEEIQKDSSENGRGPISV